MRKPRPIGFGDRSFLTWPYCSSNGKPCFLSVFRACLSARLSARLNPRLLDFSSISSFRLVAHGPRQTIPYS